MGMTREEAIRRIEDHMVHHHMGEYPHIFIGDALDTAISALREQDVTDTNVEKTNADHIRSMTDEELATTIHAVHLGWTGTWCDYHCENQGDDGCDRCVLEWLKQPYKEATDD